MAYIVALKKSIKKDIQKLPLNIRQRFEALAVVLRDEGPTGPHNWPNYSKLGKTEYHCHLNYRYAACWRNDRETIIIEVYYVGSRENAPY